MNPAGDCRACVVSGAGIGAIAILRVWGRDALAVADRAFRTARPPGLSKSPRNRPRLGRIGAGLGDEAVAIVLDGPAPEVEIQGHGGPAAQALAMAALIDAGASPGSPTGWVARSVGDPLKAEALIDLAGAPTLRTTEILLDQVAGALRGELLGLARAIEAGDSRAPAIIEGLLSRSGLGMRLTSGWEVVIAGRPNVGKSRLLNAIAGFDRAIVSPIPGTTRDVVSIRAAIDGWPVGLSDTAGIRPTSDAIEAEGIARASSARWAADLVLLILDRSEPLAEGDLSLIASEPRAIRVANKSDLPGRWPAEDHAAIEASAATGSGIPRLLEAISARLVPRPPAGGAGVPFRRRHADRLNEAGEALRRGDAAGAARRVRSLVEEGFEG